MEILFEILAAVLQIVAEIVLQLLFEGLAELGLRILPDPLRRREPLNPVLAGGGYLLLGAVAGGISLWLFPTLFIRSQVLRIANLLVTPLIAGFAMSVLGAWRTTRGQDIIRLDRFAFGYLFALTMAVTRAVWGG